jgi:hypothetical protein
LVSFAAAQPARHTLNKESIRLKADTQYERPRDAHLHAKLILAP